MKPYDEEEIKVMILDCQKRESKLSEWEYDFIENLYDQLGYKPFAQKQLEILGKIWDRIT